MTTLHSRRTAGFSVELRRDETTGEMALYGCTELHEATVAVDPAQAMTAFDHPCVFLPDAEFFFRVRRENERDEIASCVTCERTLTSDETNHCSDCQQDGS